MPVRCRLPLPAVRRLAAWAGAALLAGCVAGPGDVHPTIEMPAAYNESGPWKPAEPRPADSRLPWWQAYGDPVLDGLVQDAERANQTLRIAEAQYRQAQALADAARAGLYPTVNPSTGAQRALTNASGVKEGDAYSVGLAASWVPDRWGGARRDIEAGAQAGEVEKTIEFFEFVLDDLGTTVELEGELQVRATTNTALFRRALSNLLQNAIEHSAPGSRLAVNIARRAGAVWIGVANPGATIAAEHLPRLFDRFYRVDASRHDPGQHHGYGLGLAIVKAVASMHGGGVAAHGSNGLTTIGFSVSGAVA
ncbi:MAG: TolC family protein [Burkholderiales bacterium]|nr:TolC family protein [Burkholderiales bacterium]MDE2628289.1 TolC family protein [Burkholderiales bacterium]